MIIKDETSDKTREKYYRDFFLARCIFYGFDKNPVFVDKDVSFTIYNELTDYVTMSSHGDMLDSMAHRFVDSIKPSTIEDYGGRKPLFQESIEYYNSKELKEKIRKIVKSPRTKSKK